MSKLSLFQIILTTSLIFMMVYLLWAFFQTDTVDAGGAVGIIALLISLTSGLLTIVLHLQKDTNSSEIIDKIKKSWTSSIENSQASIMGLMIVQREKRRNAFTIFVSFIIVGYLFVGSIFSLNLPIGPALLLIGLIGWVWFDYHSMLKKILGGNFGSNEQEARELIWFILNQNNDDHHNDKGLRRLKLTQEELDRYLEEVEAELRLGGVAQ